MAWFIIEHLDKKLYKWCLLEYKHIGQTVGKNNALFTNIKKNKNTIEKFARATNKRVSQLKLFNVCILDPEAKKQLTPKDAKKFDFFIFGGIMGDYPPRKRTREIKYNSAERRNLGKAQMSTDTAVLVTKMIHDGMPIEKIKFQDKLTIPMKEGEEIELPYRYVLKNGKPVLPKGLLTMLKTQKGF